MLERSSCGDRFRVCAGSGIEMPNFMFEEASADPVFFEVRHACIYETSLAHEYHESE